MELYEYQYRAMGTCMISSANFSYMMLNLVGEVGEFASKVAKAIRKGRVFIGKETANIDYKNDSDLHYTRELLNEEKGVWDFEEELKKEAGDILWQLAGLCDVMGWSLNDIAEQNLEKLASRKKRNVIDGNGDNR